jgi:hypothetical protein
MGMTAKLVSAFTLTVLAFVATGPVASASPPPAIIALVSPSSPYSSGQLVTVTVPPNSILKPGRRLTIEECAAPPAGRFHWQHRCDARTKQNVHVTAATDGSVTLADYPLYALPDAGTLGETWRHRPSCDLSHPCVVMVGWDFDDPGHRVWSAPFLIALPNGNPGTGTPEVPYVLALPLIALAIFGGWTVLRRRRLRPSSN